MSRIIVTIHGTGRTTSQFWVPQIQAVAKQLGTVPRHHPVWWGDMIDSGAFVSRSGAWVNTHLHSLAQQWLGRPAKHTPRIIFRMTDSLHRLINGVDGVIAYFVTGSRREVVRERLRDTLAELTRQKHDIVLVSESLGCLIAFDVLQKDAARFNIAAWFTLGCPLRTLVRTGQRRADLGAINRQTVKQWFNIYAPRDPVAAPIASVFPTYPIRDERIEGTRGRLQSHRYWANPRVAMLIAQVMHG